jgi:putative transposase
MNSTNLYFSTFTSLKWIPILEKDEYKQIVAESLQLFVKKEQVVIYGFVIMPNHIHLIWKINEGYNLRDVQTDFMEHTEEVLRSRMLSSGKGFDPVLKPNVYENQIRIWDRNGLSIHLDDYSMIVQKLGFMHKNPVNRKWKLCKSIEKYRYTSFHFYLNGSREFDFLRSIYELENVLGIVENTDTIVSVAC